MHPIERLRYVARAGTGSGPALLVREAAGALASIASDPPALVTGVRRLIQRHPAVGPLWWLSARVLDAADPRAEAWTAAEEVADDGTDGILAAHLPDSATVTTVGWPELGAEALKRRGDVTPFVVDDGYDGSDLVRLLRRYDVDAVDIPSSGVAAVVSESDLVLLEATALGPDGFIAPAGSFAAAAVARQCDVPVWVVAGVGRVLPARLWTAVVARVEREGDPWELPEEIVPLAVADCVIGPHGLTAAAEAPRRADCPIAPELLGTSW